MSGLCVRPLQDLDQSLDSWAMIICAGLPLGHALAIWFVGWVSCNMACVAHIGVLGLLGVFGVRGCGVVCVLFPGGSLCFVGVPFIPASRLGGANLSGMCVGRFRYAVSCVIRWL